MSPSTAERIANYLANIERTANLLEAVLWLGFAIVFAVKAIGAPPKYRSLFAMLAAAFAAFAVSDVFESNTGAWWRPLWLLVMKVICFLVICYGFYRYYQLKRPQENPPEKDG